MELQLNYRIATLQSKMVDNVLFKIHIFFLGYKTGIPRQIFRLTKHKEIRFLIRLKNKIGLSISFIRFYVQNNIKITLDSY
jgi:hypothetical protein